MWSISWMLGCPIGTLLIMLVYGAAFRTSVVDGISFDTPVKMKSMTQKIKWFID